MYNYIRSVFLYVALSYVSVRSKEEPEVNAGKVHRIKGCSGAGRGGIKTS